MTPSQGLELWGGIECSIVRIRQTWRNQVAETGHAERDADLEAIRGLGIRTLRYPVLWEQVCASSPDQEDFSWHDRRIDQMRRLGIRPIVGLLHHGSGPRFTQLADPQFPQMFAAYARRVAERYPDVTDFTPINEPLTTARFSGLYGHWYPHKKSMPVFARMVVNQCRAIGEAMRAIRSVTAHARLIQTEDLGRIFSTPVLGYQAEYENQRRWLTFDLLHGLVDRHHPWFRILIDNGISEHELQALCDQPCVPDIIGINHYATSDRFLEHRASMLPVGMRFGGNRRHRYADLEALRVEEVEGQVGPAARLSEAWERYRRPMAVTECHHGSFRDEQLRWLHETWGAAEELRQAGADIRAVTMWALFGLSDWKSLLLRKDFDYEPGAFDIRSGSPRITALGHAAKQLAAHGRFDHPVLEMPGWWRRRQRFYNYSDASLGDDKARPIFVLSQDGEFAPALVLAARHRGLRPVAADHFSWSATSVEALVQHARQQHAWSVILDCTQGLGSKDRALVALAAACRAARLEVAFIFPLEQARLEQDVLDANPGALILRISRRRKESAGLAGGEAGFPAMRAAPGHPVGAAHQTRISHGLLDMIVDHERGLWETKHDPGPCGIQFVRLEPADPSARAGAARAVSGKVSETASSSAADSFAALPVRLIADLPGSAEPQQAEADETPDMEVDGALA